jgi:ACT domain-containing protein
MTIEQTLLQEIEDSKRWFNLEKDKSTFKRDLAKGIELINWFLENMKTPDIQIGDVIASRMDEIIDRINQIDAAIEVDPLHIELRILDWISHNS